MTPEQVTLVKQTWGKVAPIADTAADLFYGRLFEIAPEVKPLFPEQMSEQKKKLMQTLGFCVASLDRLDSIIGAVQELGVRHNAYQVEDAHYDHVGAALLWTLQQGLGENFTPEVEAAWTETYITLADVMKTAAAEART